MMASEGYVCSLDSSTKLKVTIFLYRDVQNISDIKQKLFSGEIQCCIIKANLIYSPNIVVSAANKSAMMDSQNTLTTKSIYTEMLYNLSPSRNITDSLMKFGIDEKHKHIVVAFINNVEDAAPFDNVLNAINGEQIHINKLHEYSDLTLIKKVYKLSETELLVSSLEDSVLSKLSIKDFS